MICKTEGEHKGHNTISLNQSQNDLKTSLESSIIKIDDYQGTLKEMTPKAKEWIRDAVDKTKEVAELIHEQFAMLRDAIDKKEEEIMQNLEKNEVEQEATNKLVHSALELMCEMPTINERVKVLLSECNTKKETTLNTAEEVLSIKRKLNSENKIVKKMKTYENCETFVSTEKFIKGIKRELDEINGIEGIPMKRMLCSAPTGLKVNILYSVYVSLRWDKGRQFDEYIISYCEEGRKWGDDNKSIHVDKKNDRCVVYPLKPETAYEFRVMGKIDGVDTRWSETISVKTGARVVISNVDNILQELRNNFNNVNRCVRIFEYIKPMIEGKSNKKLIFY